MQGNKPLQASPVMLLDPVSRIWNTEWLLDDLSLHFVSATALFFPAVFNKLNT